MSGSSAGSSKGSSRKGFVSGAFVDSHSRDASPPGPWPTDDQPTVISSKPPSFPVGVLTGQEWAEALVGQTLGHYELHAIVGAGGMGAVFRGHDTALNKAVAVKVLLPNSGDDEELLRRFKNEAQSAARLDHPHAARVYYVGEERGLHYIVYEFIEGQNLRDLVVERGVLSLEDAVRYTYQIADTLAHAAERDVVHRDIKPSNILITPEGNAKLVDMGLARLHQVEHTDGDLTASGVTLGTFDFISPEQARDPRTADVRSDIYSLGCTLFFVLAGRPPFPNGTVLQKLLQHEGDEPPDVRQLRADVPDELAAILRRMLAKKPEGRPQTPARLMADLARFAQAMGIHAVGMHAPFATAASSASSVWRWQRHAPWLAAAALLVVFVALLDLSSRDRGTAVDALPPIPRIEPRVSKAVNSEEANSKESSPAAPADTAADLSSNGSAFRQGPASKSATDLDADRETVTSPTPAANGQADSKAGPSDAVRPRAVADSPHPLRTALADAAGRAARISDANESPTTSDGASFALSSGERLKPQRLGPDSAPAAATALDAANVLTVVVSPNRNSAGRDTPGVYPTLDAAYAAALSGLKTMPGETSVRIELRFDGVLETRPLAISDVRVTIAAGEGFAPVLAFRPRSADPEQHPRSMLTVDAGQLTIDRVALELTLPDVPAERWSIIEARDAELVRLRDAVVTVRPSASAPGAMHSHVSICEVTTRRVVDAMRMTPETPRRLSLLAIRLDRCVVRGDATIVRLNGEQNARFTWTNGVAILAQPMIMVEGSRQSSPGAHLKATLSHVTASLRAGLVAITNTQDAPFQPVVDLESYDNVFVGDEDHPLVTQQGVDSIEDFRDRFHWKGERNFYEGWTTLWRIHGVGFESDPEDLSYRDWIAHWGRAEAAPSPPDSVIWRSPISMAEPSHEQEPADFALADTETNPAVGSGEKGSDAGAAFDQLPAIPLSVASPSVEPSPLRPSSEPASKSPAATSPPMNLSTDSARRDRTASSTSPGAAIKSPGDKAGEKTSANEE